MAQLLPPGNKSTTTTVVNGRTYTCALGSSLSNVPEFDANQLEANGWNRVAAQSSGTTANRPSITNPNLPRNYHYFDNTLGYVIVWDGKVWRNPNNGASV